MLVRTERLTQGVRRGVVGMRERGLAIALSQHPAQGGRNSRPLLDQFQLLPLDLHTRSKNALPLGLRCPFLYSSTNSSHLPWLRKPCGTSFRSRPAFGFAALSPCPVITTFISSLWFLPLPRVWVPNVRPAVVLFYNLALQVLRLICSPLFYAGQLPQSSFVFHTLYTPQSLDFISRLCSPTTVTPSLCVRPWPFVLSLISYMHVTVFCLAFFRCV